ncbi:2-dehydropantoate 2-reductase [Pseudomonas sp. HR96]|uniref:2-dehydropantoate 2-reductase n=1 Tax=Pseudomonas sp. HR96 TaxID=1027966 RepID=UPI002A761DDD|nr:2-dehydropantoate 2-reductase [Pseudomonas sp. HR96]WPP02098.1 2-dehydropantoate 2-reductase [Pseudomonas sp. HR96]
MRVLIVGAGATGGFFGARLAQAGRDVTFLVRAGRAAVLRQEGLQVLGPHGDFTVTPKLVTAADLDRHYDLIILTVKAYALDQAMADIAPAVGPHSLILPVLNGVRHLDALATRFGAQAVIGGVCKIIATLDGQGRIVQGAKINELFYGELDGQRSERLGKVDETLANAGFTTRWADDIQRDLWDKWILLASLGCINSLMRATIGEVASTEAGLAFSNALIDEVVSVAAAAGYPPGEEYLAQTRRALTLKDSAQTSSMYRDLQAGQPIEADQIVGDLLVRARQAHLPTPLLAAVYAHLSVYQQRLR